MRKEVYIWTLLVWVKEGREGWGGYIESGLKVRDSPPLYNLVPPAVC